jgi:hypothetical protein
MTNKLFIVQQNMTERKRINHQKIIVITESTLLPREELARVEDRLDVLQNNYKERIQISDNEIMIAQAQVDSLRQLLIDAERNVQQLKVLLSKLSIYPTNTIFHGASALH